MKKLFVTFSSFVSANLKRIFLIFILLFIVSSETYSQNGCDNGDFENGNFNNWTGAKGTNIGGIADVLNGTAIFNPAAIPYGSFLGNPPYDINAINMVTPGSDPPIPGITNTHLSSNYAARIGNKGRPHGLDLLAKTFTVDALTSNFSFWYELVLGSHGGAINGNPFFIVRVKNSNGVIVPNIGIVLVYPYTQNWECANLDLSSLAGQQVTVEFIAADCNSDIHPPHEGHWGYVYIDDVCLSCIGSPTGDCTVNALPNNCDNFPLQVCGNFTLPQPPAPATASLSSIDLKIYQNGTQVGSTVTSPVITGNNFCFTLNASNFPAVPPDGFDIVGSANFVITNGSVTTNITKSSSTPGNGITPGMNNDYKLHCGDTTCLNIISDTTYCDSTGTYIYEFSVHNNSPTKSIEQLEITVDSPQPPDYVVTVPSTLNFSTPIPPLGNSAAQKVKLIGPGAVAYAEVCYTLSAQFEHDDCPWCCFIENCIKLPICSCAEIIHDSLYCSSGNYYYNFKLQNGTQYNVTKIQLTSSGITPITFIPQTFHFGTPISPGQLFPNLTAQILGGTAGLEIPIRIKLFSNDFECCYIEPLSTTNGGVNWIPYILPPCDTLRMNLKSFIEGRYDPVTNSMVGDNIEVELRNNYPPYVLVETASGNLSSSGNASLEFYNAENGVNYYIVLKNSNSLETWSKSPGQSFNNDLLNYDFLSVAQAYGMNLELIDSAPLYYGILSGDVNQDGEIDLTDVLTIYNDAAIFITGNSDLNGDGGTDLTDIVLAYNNALDFAGTVRP